MKALDVHSHRVEKLVALNINEHFGRDLETTEQLTLGAGKKVFTHDGFGCSDAELKISVIRVGEGEAIRRNQSNFFVGIFFCLFDIYAISLHVS